MSRKLGEVEMMGVGGHLHSNRVELFESHGPAFY